MKIAICVPSWPPGFSPNGIVTYTSELVPALRRLGHEVFVLTGQNLGDDDPYTVDLQRFASGKTIWNRATFRLLPEFAISRAAASSIVSAIRELMAHHQVDVLEMEESFGTCLAISRLNLLPVVVRLHGPWFLNGRFNDAHNDETSYVRREKKEGSGIRDAHFVTAPSAEVLAAVRNRYALRLANSQVIINPMKAAKLSDLWDIAACNRNVFLFVGRFNARKGGDLVLRAFAELAAAYPNAGLTFVGPDDGIRERDGDIVLFQDFVRSNIPEQYRARIDFLGQVAHSDVIPLRRAHFATIVASQYETGSYSVQEAMSLGCPIIATAVGGIPELIEDRRNGLLIPSQDAAAMANACRRLLEDPALAARLGRQAWQDCGTSYDAEIIAKQTIAAYEEAIDAFKSRSKSRRYFMSSQ